MRYFKSKTWVVLELMDNVFYFVEWPWKFWKKKKKKKKTILLRAYSGYFMHGIVAHVRLSFFKAFSNFVHFCPYFQTFCPFHPFLPFFWKIVCMPLLSRIGQAIIDYTIWLSERRVFFPIITKVWELVPKSGQRNLGSCSWACS